MSKVGYSSLHSGVPLKTGHFTRIFTEHKGGTTPHCVVTLDAPVEGEREGLCRWDLYT